MYGINNLLRGLEFFLLLFLISLMKVGFSQETRLKDDLFVKVFGLDDGLRQSMVNQVYQDSNGLIWMVTGDGLHAFDGRNFRAFRVPANEVNNQSDNLMRDIVGSKPGALILSSTSSLLQFNITTGQFTVVYRKEGSYPVLFSDQLIDEKQVAWLNDLKLCLVENDKVVSQRLLISNKNEMPSNFFPVNAIRYNPTELLIYNNDGLLIVNNRDRIEGAAFEAKWVPLPDCQAVANDRMGRIFILTQGKICLYQGNGMLKEFFDTRIKEKMNLFIDCKFTFWISGKFNNKLYRLSNGSLRETRLSIHYGKHVDAIAPTIISMFEDDHNNIWMGTDSDGVLKYSPNQVQFDCSLIGFTRCITWLANDVWVGTYNNGLWRLSSDLSKAVRVLPDSYKNDIYFLDLTTDRNNRLWIATRRGIDVLSPTGKLIFRYPFICKTAKFILQPNDTIALVYDSRLIRFKSGIKPEFITNKDFVLVSSFLSAGDAYWIGSPYGLFRSKKVAGLVKNSFNDTRKRISLNEVHCLLEYQGAIWAATGNGIEIYNQDGTNLPKPGCIKELDDEVVYSLAPDEQGRIWFTSNHGISYINEKRDHIVNFNTHNNLQSLEYNSNASFRAPDGHLYFGGIRGINGLNPSRFNPGKKLPEVKLISLYVSDSAFTNGFFFGSVKLTLDRRAPHLSGKVFCSDFTNTGGQLFSFFLEGYQQAWSKPSPDADFMYRDLPAGKYRLLAKCADTWQNWSKTVVLLTIKIDRPFWKTWWFMALMTMAVAITTALTLKRINSARFRQQIKAMEQEQAIERERLRISKDMHDEVGASLTRISILSELAKKQQGEPGNTERIITQISEIAGNVVDEMSEIIWAMNPKNDNLYSFTAYFRRYASAYLETADISVKFNFPFVVPELPMSAEVCRNLFLTIKEALHNIVKHAKAGNVMIVLQIEEKKLEITICDNGHGFKHETHSGTGNGLFNMRKRIEECGGQYMLVSEVGKGTEIKISVIL